MSRAVGVFRTLVFVAFLGVAGVSDETRRAIFDTAGRLGYRHDTVPTDLAAKGRSTVGLYLLDFRNEVFTDAFRGVRHSLDSSRESSHNPEKSEGCWEFATEAGVLIGCPVVPESLNVLGCGWNTNQRAATPAEVEQLLMHQRTAPVPWPCDLTGGGCRQGRGCAALGLIASEFLHPAFARCHLLAEQSCARALPSRGPRVGRNIGCQNAKQTGDPRRPTEKGHHDGNRR